jgi:hypothetical protein
MTYEELRRLIRAAEEEAQMLFQPSSESGVWGSSLSSPSADARERKKNGTWPCRRMHTPASLTPPRRRCPLPRLRACPPTQGRCQRSSGRCQPGRLHPTAASMRYPPGAPL